MANLDHSLAIISRKARDAFIEKNPDHEWRRKGLPKRQIRRLLEEAVEVWPDALRMPKVRGRHYYLSCGWIFVLNRSETKIWRIYRRIPGDRLWGRLRPLGHDFNYECNERESSREGFASAAA